MRTVMREIAVTRGAWRFVFTVAVGFGLGLLGGCTAARYPAQLTWQDAGATRGEAPLRQDAADCAEFARQTASAHQLQGRAPTLTNVSSLGVGIAVVLAEARSIDSVRQRAFGECMRSAGWEPLALR
jgi:hypothetical protein